MGKKVLFIIFTILCVVVFAATFFFEYIPRKSGNEKNLDLISSNFFDFKTFDFGSNAVVPNYAFGKGAPDSDKKHNIILIESNDGQWSISSFSGMSVNKELSKADLDEIDIIAFVIYDYGKIDYKNETTGDSNTVRLQAADFYFYNAHDKKFYYSTGMGAKPPKNITNSQDITLKTKDINHKLRVSMKLGSDLRAIGLRVLVLIIYIVVVIIILKRKWKTE